MSVNAAFELGRLWPWVGEQHPVRLKSDLGFSKAGPERFSLGAEQEVIVVLRALVLSQTVGRLIDSHHPAVGVAVRKQGGTHARATKGIQYQWAGFIFERLLEYAKRVAGMFRARFAPEMVPVMLHHRQ